MKINFEESFELLSQDEWDCYLESDIFNGMLLDSSLLGASSNVLQNMGALKLEEIIFDHNNKVGSLRITYALCRHYYDKGIPDDPWFISLGEDGKSIQYMPNFSEEHWGRQYWFNYFTDTFYLRISALWDSIVEILNNYYGYYCPSDINLRATVYKKLKNDKPAICCILDNIFEDERYKDAQIYRNEAAHGTSAGEIHNTVNVKKNALVEVPAKDKQGNLIIESGKVKMKKVQADTVVSYGAGEYTNAQTIMTNIEKYSRFTGEKIQEIVGEMLVD